MAPMTGRRSRALESDDNDDSRPNTPSSTAPSDSKRMRRPAVAKDDADDASADAESAPVSLSLSRGPNLSSVVQSSVQKGPKYQPGAIVRVKLTNFVTYTSAEFFPGPNLNMVIGPNGTGKSTLVCAICLGLGWPPSVCTSPMRCRLVLIRNSILEEPKIPANSSNMAVAKRPLRLNSMGHLEQDEIPSWSEL